MDIKKIATDKKYPSCLSLKKKKVKSFDYYYSINQHYSNYSRDDIYNSLFNHYSYLRRRQ